MDTASLERNKSTEIISMQNRGKEIALIGQTLLFLLLDLSTACGQRRKQGFVVQSDKSCTLRSKCVQIGRSANA